MKLKQPLILFILLLCIWSGQSFAQTKKITGTVTDADGKPLQGVTVGVRGTKQGNTTTDENGRFSISSDRNSTLTFSYVGMETQEQKAGNSSDISIRLNTTASALKDVVVIGYGTARKRDVVGSADVVSAKEAGNTTSTNPSQLIIGKAAGVQVVQANGTPGADAQIIIRGTGSFTGVDPLYVIDGIQSSKNFFNALSPQDIDNITILKDASSTAIYGSSAANGVVLITTKRARSGKPRISVTSQWGTSKAWKQLKLLNAAQYVDLLKDFATTSNTSLPAKFNSPDVLVTRNDWQKQVFRSALVSENDINISGGSDKVLYNLSTGFITQQSTVKDLTYKRFNTRFSLDETLGPLHLGQSLAIRYTNTTGVLASIPDALGYAPYQNIYDTSVLSGYSIVSNRDDISNVSNPLQSFNVHKATTNEFVFLPQLFGEVSLFKGLRFRSQFSAEIGGGRSNTYQYPYTASNFLTYARQATLGYYNYNYYTFENYFSYNKSFGLHNLSATAGNSYISAGNTANLYATGSNIPNDNLQNISVSPSATVTGSGFNYNRPSLISYFGRLIYSFNNKYVLSGSARRDGASNFGANNRYGNFVGVGFAWTFSEEEFFKTLSFINNGKLRVGWGSTGNNSVPNFLTSPTTYGGSPTGNLVYSLGTSEAFTAGTTISSLANPDLRWESTKQTDAGIDLLMFNKSISLTVDYYNRKSTGLLVNVPIPASTGAGLPGTQPSKTQNAADVVNKGIEVTIGYHKSISNELGYNISGNVSYNKNNVLSLGSQFSAPIQAGSFSNLSTFTYTAAGSAIGSFYGYEVDHVAKDQAEINALNQLAVKATGNADAKYQDGLLPGDFIFKDLDKNGQVTATDQKILGNPIPKFIYGFNAGVNFKNFDLNIVISGVAGLKIVNAMKFNTLIEATGHNATTGILSRWKNPGDVTNIPKAGQNATGSANLRPSDWWLENGDYTRLRNITLGYTLPQQALNAVAGKVFTNIRIYIAAQNLFTITKYSGYDPEVSTQSGGTYTLSRGIDDGQLPQPRTFLAGLQLGF